MRRIRVTLVVLPVRHVFAGLKWIIKTFYKYSYEQISYILEHKYQVIRYKQSDGYNVYMYIDKELVDMEHLCCLAHSRAKFVYAYEQGGDLDAKYIIDCFGKLYRLEDTAYLNDGRYDIDNSTAERLIRPLAGERKNSLFFAGSRMANVSVAYHTLLSTCRMNGLSALEYLKKFFREVVNGRRDYENLLPMTIGLRANKH